MNGIKIPSFSIFFHTSNKKMTEEISIVEEHDCLGFSEVEQEKQDDIRFSKPQEPHWFEKLKEKLPVEKEEIMAPASIVDEGIKSIIATAIMNTQEELTDEQIKNIVDYVVPKEVSKPYQIEAPPLKIPVPAWTFIFSQGGFACTSVQGFMLDGEGTRFPLQMWMFKNSDGLETTIEVQRIFYTKDFCSKLDLKVHCPVFYRGTIVGAKTDTFIIVKSMINPDDVLNINAPMIEYLFINPENGEVSEKKKFAFALSWVKMIKPILNKKFGKWTRRIKAPGAENLDHFMELNESTFKVPTK
jgi:hypothetical protein